MSALRRLAARFDALTLRERIMVFAAVMVAVVALSHTLLIEPQIAKHKRLSGAALQKHSEMKAFEAQMGKLLGTAGADPRRAERDQLARVRDELALLEKTINAEERRFTAPAQMRAVLEGLLARNRSVALVEMKSLAAEPLFSTDRPSAKAAPRPMARWGLIYRHGIELTVSGSYLDLLAYARELERLPNQLYWGALELDAAAYPKVSMKLIVYTLSLDPTWLSV